MSHARVTSPRPPTPAARVVAVARRVAAHPTWLPEYVRMARDRRRGRDDYSLATDHAEQLPLEEALARTLDRTVAEVEELRADLWFPDPLDGDHTAWESRQDLLTILGVVVRSMRPEVVVETGVERGFSSAMILGALEANGAGRLHSLDLPPLGADARSFTGHVVPERLRGRWDLMLGPSRLKLPALVKRVGTIDVFLHDADHTRESQLDEFRTIWPHLRPGGVLVCDDVWNSALSEFAQSVGAEPPVLVRRWDDRDGIGLLRKR